MSAQYTSIKNISSSPVSWIPLDSVRKFVFAIFSVRHIVANNPFAKVPLMKWIVTKIAAAVLGVSVALNFGAVSAQSIFQDFEGGTALPATTFFTHDGSGFSSAIDSLTAEGIPDLDKS